MRVTRKADGGIELGILLRRACLAGIPFPVEDISAALLFTHMT